MFKVEGGSFGKIAKQLNDFGLLDHKLMAFVDHLCTKLVVLYVTIPGITYKPKSRFKGH